MNLRDSDRQNKSAEYAFYCKCPYSVISRFYSASFEMVCKSSFFFLNIQIIDYYFIDRDGPMMSAYFLINGWFLLLSLNGILQYTLKAIMVSSLVQLRFIYHMFFCSLIIIKMSGKGTKNFPYQQGFIWKFYSNVKESLKNHSWLIAFVSGFWCRLRHSCRGMLNVRPYSGRESNCWQYGGWGLALVGIVVVISEDLFYMNHLGTWVPCYSAAHEIPVLTFL